MERLNVDRVAEQRVGYPRCFDIDAGIAVVPVDFRFLEQAGILFAQWPQVRCDGFALAIIAQQFQQDIDSNRSGRIVAMRVQMVQQRAAAGMFEQQQIAFFGQHADGAVAVVPVEIVHAAQLFPHAGFVECLHHGVCAVSQPHHDDAAGMGFNEQFRRRYLPLGRERLVDAVSHGSA